jgi:hypothetical protein
MNLLFLCVLSLTDATHALFSISFWAFVGLILIFRIRITRFDGVSPLSIPSAAKDLNNAKEVVGQLLFRGHFGDVEDCDSDVMD